MKRYFSRVVALFTNRKIWVRQIVVASLAAGAAWLVGEQAFEGGGLVAAIVCSLSIRISLYKSVREGFGQILGTAIGAGRVEVLSAGSAPKDSINPIAVQAMQEVGIDISNNVPKVLTPEAVQESDAVITMGCGDACPFYPGKRYEDWVLDDPAGQGIESVRVIRDDIKKRVEQLLSELLP